jgi:hypothetical protein
MGAGVQTKLQSGSVIRHVPNAKVLQAWTPRAELMLGYLRFVCDDSQSPMSPAVQIRVVLTAADNQH